MPVHSPLPLLSPHALRKTARLTFGVVSLALFSACATDKPDPTGLNARTSAAESNGVPFSVGLASPAWQTRSVALANPLGPVPSGHAIPQVAVAQYLALQQAEAAAGDVGGRALLETDRGAVAGASVAVLSALFPAQAQSFEDLVAAQANAGPGQPHPAFRAAEAIGRAVGAQIITRMNADHFNAPNTANPPPGASWISSTNPPSPSAGGTLPGTTRWFPLDFAGQFRPEAPPAPGSTAFNTSLAEIRDFSDHRTQAMIDLAALWAPRASGYWVGVATEQIAQRGLSEREATHLYALLSATVADAMISCWDAKLTYWLIRPWNADPLITTTAAVGKPNHPSYPSGHSCVSASAAGILSSFFPDLAAQLASNVHDAGISRMVSGLHYGFDIDAGQGIGRNVAAFAIAADRSGNSVLTAH